MKSESFCLECGLIGTVSLSRTECDGVPDGDGDDAETSGEINGHNVAEHNRGHIMETTNQAADAANEDVEMFYALSPSDDEMSVKHNNDDDGRTSQLSDEVAVIGARMKVPALGI